jgi:hypothetical protein
MLFLYVKCIKLSTLPQSTEVSCLFFWCYWGLNSGLHAYKEGTLLLEPCL